MPPATNRAVETLPRLLAEAASLWSEIGHAVPAHFVAAALFAYAALDLIFMLRGLSGYVAPVWRHTEGTPFHRLNRLYYSPLCLLIAAGLSANLLLR